MMINSSSNLFQIYGYEVSAAYNGKEGFELAKKEKANLMILDVMMAYETEGFDIARKIRDDSSLNEMKVMLVSGIAKKMHLADKLESDDLWLPVDRIMEKPIDPARFIAEVDRLLK